MAVTAAVGEVAGTSPIPAIEARGITKRFGAVVACDAVDLQAHRGEIHGVLGQNGAGKTTLMNVLLGLVTADTGQILMNGKPVAIRDPLEAASRGVAMVHQHFSLIGPLTLWENITLGEKGKVDPRRSIQRATEVAERYGLDVDPRARVDDLTTGQRQRAEILKCLLRNPEVLILDEPTSVLTVAESFELFGVLRQVVREEGRAVVLISHKLDEVLYATDRVTIMRNGKVVARLDTTETDANHLAREMIGREVSLQSEGAALGHLEVKSEDVAADASGPAVVASPDVGASPNVGASPDVGIGVGVDVGVSPDVGVGVGVDVALCVRGAVAVGRDGRKLLDGLSLEVHRGEIVGVAGVEGNGQKAIGDLFSSLLTLNGGSVEVDGKPVDTGKAGRMQDAGVGIIPEDRHTCGCVLDMSVAENLVIGAIDEVCSGYFMSKRKLHAQAKELIGQFDIMAASLDAPMRSLSGGNQQRVVLARELARDPVVLVAAQPTRGLDVGAIEYMTQRIREAAGRGVAVLLISTELEEIMALADRIVVLHRGHITGEMARGSVDLERLGLLMGGQKSDAR